MNLSVLLVHKVPDDAIIDWLTISNLAKGWFDAFQGQISFLKPWMLVWGLLVLYYKSCYSYSSTVRLCCPQDFIMPCNFSCMVVQVLYELPQYCAVVLWCLAHFLLQCSTILQWYSPVLPDICWNVLHCITYSSAVLGLLLKSESHYSGVMLCVKVWD